MTILCDQDISGLWVYLRISSNYQADEVQGNLVQYNFESVEVSGERQVQQTGISTRPTALNDFRTTGVYDIPWKNFQHFQGF